MEKKKIDLYEINRSETFYKVLENNTKFYELLAEVSRERARESFHWILDDFFTDCFDLVELDKNLNGVLKVNPKKLVDCFNGLESLDSDTRHEYHVVRMQEMFGVFDAYNILESTLKDIQAMQLSAKQYKKACKEFEVILNDMFERILKYFRAELNDIDLAELADIYENTEGEVLQENGIVLYIFEGDETFKLYYDVKVSTAF